MAGEFTKDERYQIAFVLTEDLLRDYVAKIKEGLNLDSALTGGNSPAPEPLKFEVELARGGTFRTDSIDDVLALPNSGPNQVEAIWIRTQYSASPTVSLRFRSRASSLPNVSYSVTGDDREVFFRASQLEDMIMRSRAWYSRIAHADFVNLVWMLVGVVIVLFFAMLGVLALTGKLSDAPSKSSTKDTVIANLVVWTGMALLVGIGALANKLKAWLFPTGIFAFGDQLTRASRLSFWRTTIGVGIFLAFAVNIATSLLLLQ